MGKSWRKLQAQRLNTATFWCDPDFRGVSLLHANFTTQTYKPHIHETLVIAATERGGAVIESRGAAEEAPPRTLFVLNPDEPQAAWMGRSRQWQYRAAYISRSAMREAAEGLGLESLGVFTQTKLTDTNLANQFLVWHRASSGPHDPLQRYEGLITLLARITKLQRRREGRQVQRLSMGRTAFLRATEMMREHYARNLTLDELAAPLQLTKYQLIRLFARTVGLTPHRYLTQVRLQAARRYLSKGLSIADAAARSGFFDQSALTRHFRWCYGITPSQFRDAML
jgi:AraC-like DNA-binding protein